jgi:hypothetical protein
MFPRQAGTEIPSWRREFVGGTAGVGVRLPRPGRIDLRRSAGIHLSTIDTEGFTMPDLVTGWYPDPFGLHADRYFSEGGATRLVRDGGVESYDEPPSTRESGGLLAEGGGAPLRSTSSPHTSDPR